VDLHHGEREQMQAAWSAELRRKVAATEAEKARKERERVTCQSQYELDEWEDS